MIGFIQPHHIHFSEIANRRQAPPGKDDYSTVWDRIQLLLFLFPEESVILGKTGICILSGRSAILIRIKESNHHNTNHENSISASQEAIMSEKYQSLSVAELRAMLKERNVKNISGLRKAQLVQLLDSLDGSAAAAADRQKMTDQSGRRTPESERMPQRDGRQQVRISRDRSQETSDRNRDRSQDITDRNRDRSQETSDRRGRNNQRSNDSAPRGTGMMAKGILEVRPEGFGFIRSENYLTGENDVYVSHTQIRRFNLKTGDIVCGDVRPKNEKDRFDGLLYVRSVNGLPPEDAVKRYNFEDMTPVFPDRRLNLETEDAPLAMRIMDLISPIGCGQRGMIVSPPKTGKTTLIKQVARAIHTNYPDMNMIILLIDERPEEVTDIKEYIEGDNVEVIYSTFDELPEHHQRVSEMVLERAKRLVEHKKDVIILLDSITRLARACNLTVQPSGRTLTGGLDPAALYMPKRFFGSARNMREGGSLTVLATALVETGSKMDDVVFEEFKGTGNMELVLDRRLSERRVFPAISIPRSGTRREDLLLNPEELEAMYSIRRAISGAKAEEATEQILEMMRRSRNNEEFIRMIRRTKVF